MHRKFPFALIVIIIISSSFLTSFAIVAHLYSKPQKTNKLGTDYMYGYSAGTNDAKKLLAASGIIIPSISPEITSLSGTIKSISGDMLVMTVLGDAPTDSLNTQELNERVVLVSEQTKIISRTSKTTAETAAEFKELQKSTKAGKPLPPPSPFKETAVKISALSVGTTITVTANENIKNANTINATEITFTSVGTK